MKSTLAERKARFEAEGISIREWAKSHGFKERTVYAVLRGELKCKRGTSHRIAIALGIKAQPALVR